ncbi:MAG: DUF4965 domain-containing protein [Clostridiales bacterium]|nr:DUF4965 domain-containing protein [Clostridiales bacterium]
MAKIDRLPAVPLITHDPFISYWDVAEYPTADNVRHWTNEEKPFSIMANIDGVPMRVLGRGGRRSMGYQGKEITPLSTSYFYEDSGVKLTLTFTSPLLLDDLDVLSTPITYIRLSAENTDGREHDVKISFSASEKFCTSGGAVPAMRFDFFEDEGIKFGYMGQKKQSPLGESGDMVTINWGYLLFAGRNCEIHDCPGNNNINLGLDINEKTPFDTTVMVGYDDIASINYFGRLLPAYYARDGKTIIDAFKEFDRREEEILKRCAEFDAKLLCEAENIGGEDYAAIVTAAYRQSIAAHKLVADEKGNLLFISKENNSNGCAATVDVSYPSVPLYLLYCPELVRAMMRPVFKFANMPVWHYDFAPHDVGRYPVLNGQIYAAYLRRKNHSEGNTIAPYYYYPASYDAYAHKTQMPVEECGNMLLMVVAVCSADGNWDIAKENIDTLRMWCRYLIEYGEDPGEQLCTDDFAGHLARNINLSAKAIMGVAAFSVILDNLGFADEAQTFMENAKGMGSRWLERADAGDHTYLTFDKNGWSQKYNLVWDKLFGWNILPDEFYKKELRSYLPRINKYGLPLDSRAPYTKSDWTMWVAAMADEREVFDALTAPMARFLRESTSRVPFTDFYDTVTGTCEQFIARSVQGGVFMPMLMKKWTNK